MTLRIVRSGTWLYDHSVSKSVDVVGLDYDFWFEIGRADDQLELGEEPEPLAPEGFLYYARFQHAGETSEPTWVESSGRSTPEEAMKDAEQKAPSAIAWS